MKIRVRILAE